MKLKAVSGIMLMLMFVGILTLAFNIQRANAFSGSGSGTQEDPYQITNCIQLQEIKYNLSAHYILMNDIDCSDTVNWNSGAGFEPIGNDSNEFIGTFDGKGYSITGLHINMPSKRYVGLFGRTRNAYISNVSLVNVNITGFDYVGGLAGLVIYKIISNCSVSGIVRGVASFTRIGSLVGMVYGYSGTDGVITNCYSDADVEGGDVVGGLVGYAYQSNITKSYATGRVKGTAYVGGLVGYEYYGIIEQSFATGNVNGSGYVGGLLGASQFGELNNCYAAGDVNGNNLVGGLLGSTIYGWCYIANSYSVGRVIGTSSTGGLVGNSASGSSITNSYWDMETSGQTTSAGGTGKTTAEMKQQLTFSGWDFVNIWGIYEGVTYPWLQWEGICYEYVLTIYSSPTGVPFTVNSVANTTPWSEIYYENTSVSLVMPEIHTVGDAKYYWDQWSDGNTSRSRTVIMTTNLTLTAYYTGPYYELTITSSPITGIPFNINGAPQTTPYIEWLAVGSYMVEMPEFHTVGDARYYWNQWSDGNASRLRTIIVDSNITLTAQYTGPYYELTVTSAPITGVSFDINGMPQTTTYTEWLLEGSYTLEMPETYNEYVWSHWLEDEDTNRIKTITLPGTTWTAVYTIPPPPVGGTTASINSEHLSSWIAAILLIITITIASSIYFKHKKP